MSSGVETYTAYGLAVGSEVELPGMEPRRAAGLPTVTVRLDEAGGWDEDPVWSWEGELDGGEPFAIQERGDGVLGFRTGGGDTFTWDPAAGELRCEPRRPDELGWLRVLLHRVLPDLSMALGREALHATAVERPDGVIAIGGPSGSGKSTLAAELLAAGATFFTDDVLVFESGPEGALAHPGTPHMNLDSRGPAAELEVGETLATRADGERWIAVPDAASEPRPVAAVALIERAPESFCEELPATPLSFAPLMSGLPGADAAREAARFRSFADLAAGAHCLRIGIGPERSAAARIAALASAPADTGPAAVVSVPATVEAL